MENRKRDKQVKTRLSDTEYKAFKSLLERSKLSQEGFIRTSIQNAKINVVEGLQDYLIEYKRIGNNLNQLTRAVNAGKIDCKKEVQELTKEVHELWLLLKSLKAEEL